MNYKLHVIRQNRVLICLIFIVISLICSFWLIMNLETTFFKIVLPIFILPSVSILSIYSTFSKLFVQIENGQVHFHWGKKLACQFSSVKSIHLDDIRYLIIETNPHNLEFLRAIVTDKNKIILGVGKYWRYDIDPFITFLKQNSKAEVIDSWDEINNRGWLKMTYYITGMLICGATLLMVYILITQKTTVINSGSWFGLLGSYFTFIPYWFMLRNKLKNNGNV